MTTRMDMRVSSLSSSLVSSFFRVSRPPNSASGSRAVAESLLRWSHFVSLGSFEDTASAGQSAGGSLVARQRKKRLRRQVFLAENL
jgi:hypothetical protein